jgi:hypothetical protein
MGGEEVADLADRRVVCGGLALEVFYRFTVEEAIENGDRAYAALDHTARGT